MAHEPCHRRGGRARKVLRDNTGNVGCTDVTALLLDRGPFPWRVSLEVIQKVRLTEGKAAKTAGNFVHAALAIADLIALAVAFNNNVGIRFADIVELEDQLHALLVENPVALRIIINHGITVSASRLCGRA